MIKYDIIMIGVEKKNDMIQRGRLINKWLILISRLDKLLQPDCVGQMTSVI